MAKSAADIYNRWLQMMQSPTTAQNYTAGVNAVQVNPAQAAMDAQDQYLAGVQQAVNDGRYKAGLQNVTLQGWKAAATGKGAQRLAQGAQAASGKAQAAYQKWAPIYANAAAAAAALPKGGKANAMARVSAVYDIMKQGAGKTIT